MKRFSILLWVLVPLLLNCQDNNTQNKPDAGTQELRCQAGNACLQVSQADVRSCEVLLTNSEDVQSPQVGYGKEVIGTVQFRDKRLAVGFVLRADSALGGEAAVVKLPSGVKDLQITTANCYNKQGAKVAEPGLSLQKP
ncbi:MAG: hypothetical protein AAGJ35_06030 [Myxococcota bacterium]